jgi:DNA-binding transcriptional MerR regulator
MQDIPSRTDLISDLVWIGEEETPPAAGKAPVSEQTEFTIGELAREFGMTLRALRFYENKGLINPRREGNARIYNRSDRARVALIRSGKKLGFTLSEIRAMLTGQEGRPDPDTLRLSKEKCLEQIRLLEKQQHGIRAALAELWRIHAGLSAEMLRHDDREPEAGALQCAG